jgi:hypothetical protein
VSPIEEKVTGLLAELADARPVVVGAPPVPEPRPSGRGGRPDYVPVEAASARSRRRSVLVAAAVVLVLAVVGGLLVLGRGGGSPVVASLSDLPVDTSLLGDGRMAVVVENQLYVADGPTGQVWKLTDTGRGEEVSNVSFSHDGEWVAFTIHDESGLWVSRWDGSESHRVGRAPSSYTWSPTDDQLAYATQDQVRIAQTDGSSRALSGGPTPLPYTNVVWSPNGESLAFAMGSYPGQGALVTVTPQGADDPGWGKPSLYTTSANVVYAWPLDGVTVSAVGQGRGQLQADLLLSVRSQALTDVVTNTVPDPVDASGVTVVVVSPDTRAVSWCDLAVLSCSALGALPADWSYVDPVLAPSAGRVAVVGGIVGSNLFVVDLASGQTRDLGQVSTGYRGAVDIGRQGYGVGSEPPVWIDDLSLLVRVDSSSVVRIDVGTGARSLIVAGDRFLPPADDYPGGTGLAYWTRP